MRSDTHKVLHPIAGKPMLMHLLSTGRGDGRRAQRGCGRQGPRAAGKGAEGHGVATALQAEQKGTGHAVQMAEEALSGADGPVLILYGDTPFVDPRNA